MMDNQPKPHTFLEAAALLSAAWFELAAAIATEMRADKLRAWATCRAVEAHAHAYDLRLQVEDPDTWELLRGTRRCICGHVRDVHHGDPGRGPCMVSTETDAWACDCAHYIPLPR